MMTRGSAQSPLASGVVGEGGNEFRGEHCRDWSSALLDDSRAEDEDGECEEAMGNGECRGVAL